MDHAQLRFLDAGSPDLVKFLQVFPGDSGRVGIRYPLPSARIQAIGNRGSVGNDVGLGMALVVHVDITELNVAVQSPTQGYQQVPVFDSLVRIGDQDSDPGKALREHQSLYDVNEASLVVDRGFQIMGINNDGAVGNSGDFFNGLANIIVTGEDSPDTFILRISCACHHA